MVLTEHVFCCDDEVLVVVPVHRTRTQSYCIGGKREPRWWTVLVVVLLWCTQETSGSPLGFASRRDKRTLIGDNVQNYLMNFGYLPQSDLETGNLRTDDQLRAAIRTLQSFGHIPETGELDEETRELLKKPRCGRPDIETRGSRRKRYALHGRKWDYTNLTWSLQTRDTKNLDPRLVRVELGRALDVWAQNSRLTFNQINSDRADILVNFYKGYHGDGYPFDGRGQILAHAFFPGSGRGGDAHFDEEENWILHDAGDDAEGTSLFAVAAHEFGHSLGLSHSSVQGALMYPWYQGIKSNFQLPDDDRHGIQQLYGAKEDKPWANIPQQTPRKDYPRPTQPPSRPEQPEYPRQPERPRQPEYPRQPERPRQPEYPRQPERPRQPEYPRQPERPRQPEYPRQPEHPRQPEYPRQPEHPRQPSYPRRPDYPRQPDYPRDPVHPRYPTHEVTTHPPRRIPPRRPESQPNEPDEKPNTCDTSYDAISVIRREVFIFKGKYLWRIGDNGLSTNYPVETKLMWTALPEDFTHIDAVYERNDKKIVFFIGKQFYLFDANHLERGYPRPLTHLGLPSSLEKIDGAMVWGHNKKTYFFSGDMYWRYDEDVGSVELDYPRDMSMWRGVGYNIDAVFQWKDGKTYFFKGKGFWKFNDLRMRVENEKQMSSGPSWMGCAEESGTHETEEFPSNKAGLEDTSGDYSAASSRTTLDMTMFIILLCWRLVNA